MNFMKTLIAYATKHGATRDIAAGLKKAMEGAELCDLGENPKPNLDEYDCVIIGGSLYAGMLRKEAKRFAAENAEVLQGKTLGFFLVGLAPADGGENYFAKNFPEELMGKAKAHTILQGRYDPASCGFWERQIMKLIGKGKAVNLISDEAIRAFAEKMQA